MTSVIIVGAVRLIVLHGAGGHEAYVNPSEVTSLRPHIEAAKEKDKLFPKDARCLINLSDGKFVTVVETCDEVRRLMEQVNGDRK